MWWSPLGKVPEISAEELHHQLSTGTPSRWTLIDVRTLREFEGGHIAGALNTSMLPPWSFTSRVMPLLQGVAKDQHIVVICLGAHRSPGAQRALEQEGFTHVVQLKGGMQAWRDAKLPEVHPAEATLPPAS